MADIFALNTELSKQHDLPLTVFNQENGFVFQLKKNDLDGSELPRGFINVVVKKGKYTFSSLELVGHSGLL